MNALTGRNHRPVHEPFRLVQELDGRGGKARDQRPQRHVPRHGGRPGASQRPHGPAEGFRRRRLRLLHQWRKRQGERTGGASPTRRACCTGRACAGNSAFAARWSRSATPNRTPISPAARATAASAPGRASSRGRWRADFALEKAVALQAARFNIGPVPRPPYWGGYRIRPVEIEFWSDKPFRLHERIRYTREKPEGDWVSEALYP